VELTSGSLVTMRFGGFINHVRDLIESSIIARKTNGQNVYTYFNLHRILTEGAETEATVRPLPWLTFSAGYQFLLTYDLDMLDSIRAQKIYKVGVTGITRPVQRVEYGGLFNRSHNTGNVKVGIDRERQEGFTILLRGLFRDRYGYTDFNHNKILDDDREYARGYALWNFDVTQRLSRFVALRAGVENIANEQAPVPLESTDPSNPVRTVPSLPGRILRAGIEVRYF
jgi:outer membrane receptor for ferrienterochelin and colicins